MAITGKQVDRAREVMALSREPSAIFSASGVTRHMTSSPETHKSLKIAYYGYRIAVATTVEALEATVHLCREAGWVTTGGASAPHAQRYLQAMEQGEDCLPWPLDG